MFWSEQNVFVERVRTFARRLQKSKTKVHTFSRNFKSHDPRSRPSPETQEIKTEGADLVRRSTENRDGSTQADSTNSVWSERSSICQKPSSSGSFETEGEALVRLAEVADVDDLD